jgi:hypothetical protein
LKYLNELKGKKMPDIHLNWVKEKYLADINELKYLNMKSVRYLGIDSNIECLSPLLANPHF